MFLFIGTLFGLLFLVLTPPFKVPDEPNHFLRAAEVSRGNLKGRVGPSGTGDNVPENFISTIRVFDGFPFHEDKEQKIENIFAALHGPAETGKAVFADFPNTAEYSPVPYLPQAMGITAGRLAGCSPLAKMYIGRFANLALWIFLVYFAIKVLPFKKWLFFLLALTPMSVSLAASLSADCITNGLTFVLTALFLRIAAGREKIEPKQLLLLFILSLLLSLSKQAYFVVSFLFLLIPVDRIGTRRKYFSLFSAFILCNIAAVLLWSLSVRELYEHVYIVYARLLPDISPSSQLRFIIFHPLDYAAVVVRTMMQNGKSYFDQFIGQLGWMDISLSEPMRILYSLALLLAAVMGGREEPTISKRQKAVLLATASSGAILILTLAYISFTPVGSPVVGGIQGRYFIPLAPLFFLLFSIDRRRAIQAESRIRTVLILLPVLTLSHALFAVVGKYYG
ncbi:MAG: DUF2142 domain-containing protein [Candidatus Sulfobium sp.]